MLKSTILEEIKENVTIDELDYLVKECNAWDGCLDHLDYMEFDEDFFNTYFYNKPMEAARATHFGDVNWNDDYIHFDGYGNLESASIEDYESELEYYKDEIIENALELYENNHIDIPDSLLAYFNEYIQNNAI